MEINYLRIPIAYLFDIDSLHDFTEFKESGLEYFANGYEEPDLNGIIEALKWATENPEHDFSSMLPNINIITSVPLRTYKKGLKTRLF